MSSLDTLTGYKIVLLLLLFKHFKLCALDRGLVLFYLLLLKGTTAFSVSS